MAAWGSAALLLLALARLGDLVARLGRAAARERLLRSAGALLAAAGSDRPRIYKAAIGTALELVGLLRGLDCRFGQGFYLSEPVEAAELGALLHRGRRILAAA